MSLLFIDNKLEFRTINFSNLVIFLKRTDYNIGELLEGSSIDKTVKFREDEYENVYKWNKDIFKEYLVAKGIYIIFPKKNTINISN